MWFTVAAYSESSSVSGPRGFRQCTVPRHTTAERAPAANYDSAEGGGWTSSSAGAGGTLEPRRLWYVRTVHTHTHPYERI